MSVTATEPEISVVVPCRGHAAELSGCLRSLERQVVDVPFELIVVDSAADAEVAAAVAKFPSVCLIRSQAGLFSGDARNLGVRHARGRYLAFIDADCHAEAGWLQAALDGLRDGARLIGGPVLDARPAHPVASMDNLMQFADFAPRRPDGPAPHFPGCNFAIGRATFDELGGFPVAMRLSGDTVLTAAAARRWPDRVLFSRRMRIRHDGRRRIAELWRHHEDFGYQRARLGLRLSAFQRRWGHRAAFAALFAWRRLAYFVLRAVQWNPQKLPQLILFSPALLIGLTAWARGLRRGCWEARHESG